MGTILWEDSIQQALQLVHVAALRDVERHDGLVARELRAQRRKSAITRGAHTRYASRRSAYFLHTRSGKRQASRPLEN